MEAAEGVRGNAPGTDWAGGGADSAHRANTTYRECALRNAMK